MAKLINWLGLQSTFAPASNMIMLGENPRRGPPIAGLSMPSNVPKIIAADAIVAPLEPMDTLASETPFLIRDVLTIIEALGFCLIATAGCSFSVM